MNFKGDDFLFWVGKRKRWNFISKARVFRVVFSNGHVKQPMFHRETLCLFFSPLFLPRGVNVSWCFVVFMHDVNPVVSSW